MTTASRQSVADQIKNAIDQVRSPADRANPNRKAKRLALDALNAFEQAPWTPGAFAEAIKIAAPTVRLSNDGIQFGTTAQPLAVYQAIANVLQRYFALSNHKVELTPTLPPGKLDTKEAAAYLEMPIRTFRDHLYEHRTVHGELHNGTKLLFDITELDRFQRWYDQQRGTSYPLKK